MRSLALISLLLSLVLVGCSAYSWNDCGAPLSRIISFQNVVAYPESPDSQDRLSLSVQATVMSSFNDATTNILVIKDGELYLSVEGRSLCTILATTQNTITCPVAPGQYSFNYVYPLPTLSAGTYTVVITFNDISSGAALGCVSTSLSVSNPASSSCRYTSSLKSTFGTTRLNTNNNATIGSWIQIGPYGNNAGAAGSTFPWGRFVNFVGTTDVIDIAINPSPYVWGLNGSLISASNSSNGGVDSFYAGDFVIGYTPYTVSSSLANVQIISTGQFNITLNYVAGRSPRETVLTGGSLTFNPQYSLPYGFYYPLIFGGLGTYNVQQNSDGSLQASASRVYCACAVDACGVCGGDGRTCGSYLTATAAPRRTGLTSYDIAAIVIGAFAFLLLLVVLALLLMLRRRGREERNVRDDTDLAGPDKPDYGSMAINEVLADHGRPVIVA